MTPEMLSWIEKQKPELVGWAEKYVQGTKLFEPKGGRGKQPKVSGSQLRNLLNAAQGGSPLAVIINLLRYQIGRGGRGWPEKPSGQTLESLFTGKLRPLIKSGVESLETPDREAALYELESQVTAQLLGFIIREYTYRCALEGTSP